MAGSYVLRGRYSHNSDGSPYYVRPGVTSTGTTLTAVSGGSVPANNEITNVELDFDIDILIGGVFIDIWLSDMQGHNQKVAGNIYFGTKKYTHYNDYISPDAYIKSRLLNGQSVSVWIQVGSNSNYDPSYGPSGASIAFYSGDYVLIEVYYDAITRNCDAPTSASISPNIVGSNGTTFSWSGAKGYTGNTIVGYDIQYCDSTNGTTWGSWSASATVSTTDTYGTYAITLTIPDGNYRKYRIRTRGSAGVSFYSSWKESNTIRKNIPPNAPSTAEALPLTYTNEQITITWSGATGNTSSISGYQISGRDSTDNATWGNWYVIDTINHASSYGTYITTLSKAIGTYTQFSIQTIDTVSSLSTAGTLTNSVLKLFVSPEIPVIDSPLDNAIIYNTSPRILIRSGGTVDDGRLNTIHVNQYVSNVSNFSVSGDLINNTKTICKMNTEPYGALTITAFSEYSGQNSNDVIRNITITDPQFPSMVGNVAVKAEHITHIQNIVNDIRHYYGLNTHVWQNIVESRKTQIKYFADHIIEIRRVIDEVITVINDYDNVTVYDIPHFLWEDIGTGRPKKIVMTQIFNIIMSL